MSAPSTPATADMKSAFNIMHQNAGQMRRCLQLVVTTNDLRGEGIFAGDILSVDKADKLVNGQLLVLEFDGRMVVRRLEMGQGCMYLHPLHHKTQMLEWPLHVPLPLTGVVRQIVRKM
jgi:SOS-response transcriptional repressor LexA